jgi:hypothetical protein
MKHLTSARHQHRWQLMFLNSVTSFDDLLSPPSRWFSRKLSAMRAQSRLSSGAHALMLMTTRDSSAWFFGSGPPNAHSHSP